MNTIRRNRLSHEAYDTWPCYTILLSKMCEKAGQELYFPVIFRRIAARIEERDDLVEYVFLDPSLSELGLDLDAVRELRDVLQGYFDADALASLERTMASYEPETLFCRQLASMYARAGLPRMLRHWVKLKRRACTPEEEYARQMVLDVLRHVFRLRFGIVSRLKRAVLLAKLRGLMTDELQA